MLTATPGSGFAANISIIIVCTVVLASFGFLMYKHHRKQVPLRTVMPFILNAALIANLFLLSFLHTNGLLTVASVLLLPFTTLWGIVTVWKKYKLVAIANILLELFFLYVIAMLILIILVLAR